MKFKNIHLYIKVFVVVLFSLFTTINTFSQNLLPDGSFFITEVNWDGGWILDDNTKSFKSNSTDEWFEVFNNSDEVIPLDKFNIKGFSTSNKDLQYKNPEKCIIAPYTYLVVARLESSPTIGSSNCVATNMSISNTNISINITSKVDNMAVQSDTIGDPSKLIKDTATNYKSSIVKKNSLWTQSSNKVSINQINDNLGNNYYHFASPKGPDVSTDLNLIDKIEYNVFPASKILDLNTTTVQDFWKIENLKFRVYDQTCVNNMIYIQNNIWDIGSEGLYCLVVIGDIKNNLMEKYQFHTSKKVEIKRIQQQPNPGNPENTIKPNIYITELDLNADKLELYNSDDIDWELKNFYIQDMVGSTKKVEIGDDIIKSKSYLVLDLKTYGISLNNSGDNVMLIYNDKEIDKTNSPIKTLKVNYTYQYFKNEKIWESALETLGGENIKSIITQEEALVKELKEVEEDEVQIKSKDLDYFKSKIRLNEIHPEGDEFVEIYNLSEEDLDLSGLELGDIAGKTKKYIIPSRTTLKQKSFYVLSSKKFFNLNNNGDGVEIKTSKGDLLDKVEYKKSEGLNLSYQFAEGVWFWGSSSVGVENTRYLDQENDDEEKENNTSKQALELENCSETIIYAQISKNIFINNEFRFEVKNVGKINFPAKVNICGVSIGKDNIKAKNLSYIESQSLSKLLKIKLTETITPSTNSVVEFSLPCSGIKNVKIKQSNISIRKTYNSNTKLSCVNNFTSGYGLFIKQPSKSILYLLESKSAPSSIPNTQIKKESTNQIYTMKNTITAEEVLIKFLEYLKDRIGSIKLKSN